MARQRIRASNSDAAIHHRPKRRLKRWAFLSLAATAISAPAGITHQWTGGTGFWNTATNWTPNGVPGAGDTANIISLLGTTQEITYNYTGTSVQLSTVNVDLQNATGGADEVLNIGANLLIASTEIFGGYSGSSGGGVGFLLQNGGINSFNTMYLGYNALDTGACSLSGAAQLVGSSEYIGYQGTGSMLQSGGSNTTSFVFVGGLAPGATGNYSLSSTGSLLVTSAEYVGDSGNGVFNQTGNSTNTITGSAQLFVGIYGTGAYLMSGTTTLTCSGLETIGSQGGSGLFNQSGGTNSANGGLIVGGSLAGSNGTYNLTAPSILSVSGNEEIGVSGGTGSVVAVNGGSDTVSGNLDVGFSANSVGSLTCSNSTINALSIFVGGSNTGAGGKGSLVINDNAYVTTFNPLVVYNTPGTIVNFSGGGLTAPSLNMSGNASEFNWTAGTLTLTSAGIEVDSSAAANLPNGTVIGPNSVLSVTGSEIIGGTGFGNLIQTGGSNGANGTSNVELGLNTFSTGVYTLSGTGQLVATNMQIGVSGTGILNQSGSSNCVALGSFSLAVSGGTGTYIMSGGTLQALDGINLAETGSGSIVQSGGDILVNQFGATNGGLLMATTFSSTASYVLSGTGSLYVVGPESIGVTGNAAFTQSGGVNTVSSLGFLAIGSGIASTTCSYTLTGGSVFAGISAYVGGGGVAGAATLNVSGGVFDIDGPLVLEGFGDGANLTGGTIILQQLITNNSNSPLLNWTGGTLEFSVSQTFSQNASLPPSVSGFGGALSLGTGQCLVVSGNETLGGTGSFALTLNSGSQNSVSGTLTVTPNATLTQNPGSVLYAGQITQAGGTINGTLQNQGIFDYQSGVFNGQLLNQGTVEFGQDFVLGNGILNQGAIAIGAGQTLTPNGAGLDNLGNITLAGGTLNGGPLLNDVVGVIQAKGTIGSAITNNGIFTVTGPLSTAGITNNYFLDGGGLITGTVINNPGATIEADAVHLPLALNSFQGNGSGANIEVAANAELTIANSWINSGLVTLDGSGAILAGGAITNTATIQGAGEITAAITNNTGVIRGSGGELNLSSAGIINGASGQIQAATGDTVLAFAGLAGSSGEISLTGGTFDNNNHIITNTGYISGWGTFRSGGLSNNAFLDAGGNFNVFGPVANGATGVISATGTGLNAFFGPVTNNSGGSFSVQGGASVTFFNSYTGTSPVNNSGTVTFAVASTSGPITGGGQTIVGNGNTTSLQLVANGGTSTQKALFINNGSSVDLTNNTFFVDYGSGSDPVSAIASYLTTGYAAEKWTGIGIDSSTVANLNATQSQLIYAIGYADGADGIVGGLSSGQIEIMPTLAGDAKLQGGVNFGDFQILAQYLGQSGGWDEGNFTYGPTVDFGDFQQLAQDFGATDSALTSGQIASMNSFAEQYGDTLVPNPDGIGFSIVSVPEPAGVGVLLAAGLGLTTRRRKKRRQR